MYQKMVSMLFGMKKPPCSNSNKKKRQKKLYLKVTLNRLFTKTVVFFCKKKEDNFIKHSKFKNEKLISKILFKSN